MKLWRRIAQRSAEAGQQSANAQYDAAIAAQQAQIETLRTQQAALQLRIEEQAKRAVASMTVSLTGSSIQLDPVGMARMVQRGNREIQRRG